MMGFQLQINISDLSNNQIYDDGFLAISYSIKESFITDLDLSNNQIGDETIKNQIHNLYKNTSDIYEI